MSTAINAYTSMLTNNYNMDFGKASTSGTSGSSTGSASAKTDYASSYIPEGLEKALQQALKEISALKNGAAVKSADISEYRDTLESAFAKKVREDLENLGITDMNFTISLDPTADNDSAITITANNAQDKAIIEKYFASNPAVVEDFRKIQALSNMEKAMKQNSVENGDFHQVARNIKADYQAQALDIFLSEDSDKWDFTSMMASFNGSSTSFSSGINMTV